jgi:hypothetical protein
VCEVAAQHAADGQGDRSGESDPLAAAESAGHAVVERRDLAGEADGVRGGVHDGDALGRPVQRSVADQAGGDGRQRGGDADAGEDGR